MDDRVLRLRVGVVVLAAALITAFLVARFGDLPLPGAGTYTVYVRFPRAPGVSQGTPVRISGVQIGRVTSVELLQPTGVRVVTEIESGRTILDSYACWITSATVLGDSVLEFVPPDPLPAGTKPIENRTEIINGRVAANPLEVLTTLEPNLKASLASFQQASQDVSTTARNFNAAIGNNADQIPRFFQKAERAVDEFGTAMTNVNSVFGEQRLRDDLRESLRNLPQTLEKANTAFESMRLASDRAAQNLESLKNFTKPLGERGPQLVDNLDGSLANINELLEQLVTFTDNLNTKQGTLGRILNDDALYLRLERTLANAEDLTAQMKPILADIRVFSDKIARDPRQLGLKGALDKRPLGTGTKAGLSSAGSYEMPVHGDAWDPVVVP